MLSKKYYGLVNISPEALAINLHIERFKENRTNLDRNHNISPSMAKIALLTWFSLLNIFIEK
jgi:hypothetical protein